MRGRDESRLRSLLSTLKVIDHGTEIAFSLPIYFIARLRDQISDKDSVIANQREYWDAGMPILVQCMLVVSVNGLGIFLSYLNK